MRSAAGVSWLQRPDHGYAGGKLSGSRSWLSSLSLVASRVSLLRGFAVVSDEVRVLANNTQQSATEINALLGELKSGSNAAVGAMDQGLASSSQAVGDAQNAGDYLLEISGQVEEITELNRQIASTTEHQAHASKQIHTHMDDFRQCSHQVSQSTDQLEALSHQLSGIVTELSKSTSQFKV